MVCQIFLGFLYGVSRMSLHCTLSCNLSNTFYHAYVCNAKPVGLFSHQSSYTVHFPSTRYSSILERNSLSSMIQIVHEGPDQGCRPRPSEPLRSSTADRQSFERLEWVCLEEQTDEMFRAKLLTWIWKCVTSSLSIQTIPVPITNKQPCSVYSCFIPWYVKAKWEHTIETLRQCIYTQIRSLLFWLNSVI